MGFITDFFKELYQEQCKPANERYYERTYLFPERDLDEKMNNDMAEENTLLYHDAFENNYDTEEIKKIKQSLYSSGCKDLSRAYEIAEKLRKQKEENIRKYYNKKKVI